MNSFRRRFAGLCAVAAPLLVCSAADDHPAPTPPAIQELVRAATANEVRVESAHALYMYRERLQLPKRVLIIEHIETQSGALRKLLFLNGKPLTEEQRTQWEKSVSALLADPALQSKRLKNQQEEEERTRKLFGALPEAFLFQLEEREAASGLVRIKLQPNPHYQPPSRELQPLAGMEGKLWIDPVAQHIARVDVTLFRDVDFGWGMLGKLYRGGHIVMEEAKLPDGNWRIVNTVIKLTGRILFKGLQVDEAETTNDFEHTPDGFTLANAVGTLRALDPKQCDQAKAALIKLRCAAD